MADENTETVQETTPPNPDEAPQDQEKETPQETETKTKEGPSESKTDDAKEEKPDAESEKKVVPEKYDLKLSENSSLDKSAIDRIAAYAKAQGLSQEEAQSLVETQEADVAAFIEERKQTWKDAAINDKEIGGEALNENIALASRAIDRFASPALKEELNKTGYGNHPELVRMFAKIGKAMADDKAIIPGSQGTAKKPLHDILYDNTNA